MNKYVQRELIVIPMVVSESTAQKLITTETILPQSSLKIRDIEAEIKNLDIDTLNNKVIVQGLLHKQIFYITENNCIRHLDENILFNNIIELPGVYPEMDIKIIPEIKHISFELAPGGERLIQKIILKFQVLAIIEEEALIETGDGPLVRAKKVIGENHIQSYISDKVLLNTIAEKIIDIDSQFIDISVEILQDKVIIEGSILLHIYFIGEDTKKRSQEFLLEFSDFAEINGVNKGMDIKVLPQIECINQILSIDKKTLCIEILLGLFIRATERISIQIEEGNDFEALFPKIIGEKEKQLLIENNSSLEDRALKVNDINTSFSDIKMVVLKDKVLIDGIINMQIFYINDKNKQRYVDNIVPFIFIVDLIGARPGMDVCVIPEILFKESRFSASGKIFFHKFIIHMSIQITDNIIFKPKITKAKFSGYIPVPETGTVSGTVIDATNNQPLPGVTISIGALSATTDENGQYSVTGLAAGIVYLVASLSGYVEETEQAEVKAAQVTIVDFALSPVLAPGEHRIVLTWGLLPRDLDSHLLVPVSDSDHDEGFHVFYANKGISSSYPYAELDVDDVDSFGPETITITQLFTQKYKYYIYNYSGEADITTSEAEVKVYDNTGLIKTYNVPTSGSGRYWYVFDISSTGIIIDQDIIQNIEPDLP